MYNNPYISAYNPQSSIDRINAQINELEKMKQQMQQPVQATPTNLTQNFQLVPNRDAIRYANSLDEVQRDTVIGDTPYFSKDMSIVWVKNVQGNIKTYELKELIEKDEKDLKIEFLMAQMEDMKKELMNNAKSNNTNDDEPIENEKSTSFSDVRASKKK